mmetsp:Transcript_6568/g.9467  ORF Transcript_6568/g.9467 Transcript_6568/m.9467 type:complete len:460 (+) Transcript_6568:241-1620(+)|eukprot:CAMPEP_0202465574 /NCGR_PEP_ID=MMETSP1360-20130828/65981_1 /ASSEMBLY_ACC=CAM_ASM_000848 /TAXON_ID=515479 /ORGANISM="Licmophora paradoxa, Strain CCMP2313" /LENGTH=459 /DNA_ID=CAMNT_0049089345 /DNA_START=199 /DNA_END=1578 /DNA_ORIENTATION=+
MNDSNSDSETGDETSKHVPREDDMNAVMGVPMSSKPNVDLPSSNSKSAPGATDHVVVSNPNADQVDLSTLRGTRAPAKNTSESIFSILFSDSDDEELDALAELVPQLKPGKDGSHTMTFDNASQVAAEVVPSPDNGAEDRAIEVTERKGLEPIESIRTFPNRSIRMSENLDETTDDEDTKIEDNNNRDAVALDLKIPAFPEQDFVRFQTNDNSDHAIEETNRLANPYIYPRDDASAAHNAGPYAGISSAASQSTATQTHEVKMPMFLPTFKPATGCTNASDFIVRCFVARLRSGIAVVKHGRHRWAKSRYRVLQIHPDGRSLSWKPAEWEPSSSKRPPKLDLSTCSEVRHAWSPDPLNSLFTGTPILRQKCEAANAHKSFALVFPKRTVDITAATADQCKVLMEGFSALCFRLHVATLAGRNRKAMRDGDEEATTASVTLTNNSTSLASPGGFIRSRRA